MVVFREMFLVCDKTAPSEILIGILIGLVSFCLVVLFSVHYMLVLYFYFKVSNKIHRGI